MTLSTNAPATDLPAAETVAAAEATGHQPWHLGVAGYRLVQESLAAAISPGEAHDAEQLFRRSRREFAATASTLLLMHLARASLLPKGNWAWAISYDVLSAAVLGALLYFAARWRMPYVARLLLPLHAAFWSFDRPLYEFEQLRQSFVVQATYLTPLLIAIAIGFLIDLAVPKADTEEADGNWPRGNKMSWSVAGAILVLVTLAYAVSGAFLRPPPFFTLLTAVALLAWPWIGWGAGASKWHRRPRDVRRLFDAAQLRWGRVLAGRLLAILLTLLPLLMFLSALGLGERMRWPEAGEAIVTRNRSPFGDPSEKVWFWSATGSYLRPADFDEYVIFHYDYYTRPSAGEPRHPADSLKTQAVVGPEAEPKFDEWIATVGDRRLRTPQDFVAYAATTSSPSVRCIRKLRAAPSYAYPQGTTVAQVRIMPLESFTRQKADALLLVVQRNIPPFVVFASLGFLTLWRRGGDSSTAWWLGVWLLASTAAFNAGLISYYFESLQEELLLRSLLGSAIADFVMLMLSSLFLVYILLFVIYLLGVPTAGMWVHLCWPNSAAARPRPVRWAASVGKIAAVTAAMRLFQIALVFFIIVNLAIGAAAASRDRDATDLSRMSVMWLMGLTATLALIAAIVDGWHWRKKTAKDSESPYLTWRSVLALICAQISLVLFYPAGINDFRFDQEASIGSSAAIVWWIGVAFLVGFVVLATLALLRDNFLRLAAVRDYSTLIVMFLLPVTFETLEGFAGDALATVGSLLHSEQGIAVITTLLTIAVLGPLWSLLQRVFTLVSAPRARIVERSAAEALERMVSTPMDADTSEEIERFLAQAGIHHYSLYAREGHGAFRLTQRRLEGGATEQFTISPMLRDFFAARPRFLDLHDAPYEWSYFFQQFELLRLQQSLECRFLLPICLGPSVRGLLVLPNDEQVARSTQEVFAENVGRVGLDAVRR